MPEKNINININLIRKYILALIYSKNKMYAAIVPSFHVHTCRGENIHFFRPKFKYNLKI